jgi:hypothetical protein
LHNGIIDGVRRISNSEIQTYKECKRKWWLSWYRGLRFAFESPVELKHTGDRVHRALQPWYVPEGETRVDPREALEVVIQEDRDVLLERLGLDGSDPTAHDDWTKIVKANDLERVMVEGYMQWLEETGEDENLEITASETYLESTMYGSHPLGDNEVRLVAKIDVRGVRRSDRVRVFIDHKTKAAFPPYDELQRDEQMQFYLLIESLSLHDENLDQRCEGALYNVLRRVKRTARAKPPFYRRDFVPHSERTRGSFLKRVMGTVTDMLMTERLLDGGRNPQMVAYPTPSNDCSWKCPFVSICTMFDDGSRVEDLLDRYYVAGDPLHYYGDLHTAKTRTSDEQHALAGGLPAGTGSGAAG